MQTIYQFEQYTPEIYKFWEPFSKQLQIPYLAYETYDLRTGNYSTFTNYNPIMQEFISKNLFPSQEEAIGSAKNYQIIILSPQVNYNLDYYSRQKHEKNIAVVSQCGVYHRLCFVKDHGHWGELFSYGSPDPINGLQQMFKHIDILQKINIWMPKQTELILQQLRKDPIIIPGFSIDKYELLQGLGSKTDQDKLIALFNRIHKITNQEFVCLKLTAQGKTAKQIAQVLLASPRTIEVHLEHVKRKLAVNNKLELCNKYYEYFPS